MRVILLALLIFTSVAATAEFPQPGVQQTGTPPNIVVIFADDLGYCETEIYGCDLVPTPNIKSLADEGVAFTSGYVTSPVCSPSRASLLTGQYQHRFGFEYIPTAPEDGLAANIPTLADALKKQGYVTGMVGKWHMGEQAQHHPLNHGFDEYFGYLGWGGPYIDDKQPEAVFGSRHVPLNVPLWRGKQQVQEDQYLTDVFTREAVAFIDKHQAERFFLYLPYTANHEPLETTEAYFDRVPQVADKDSRVYAAMRVALDDGVGKVLASLEKHGLTENTIVILLSDNGAGIAPWGDNSPLRMGKSTFFEGGIRIPFALKWPAKVAAGQRYDKSVSSLDIFPTAVAAAGGELTANTPHDGVDLLPYLSGANGGQPHEQLYWRASRNWAIRDGNWKLIFAADRYWLYDLSKDIGEKNNLAAAQPDTVARLKATYDGWDKQMMQPAWSPMAAKTSSQFAVDGVDIRWEF